MEPTIQERANKMLRYRWICLATLWLVYFFVYFDRVAPAVVAPELMKTFNISATSLGLLSAAYFYPYAAMQIPSGVLADFLGPRLAVTIFFVVAGIGTALFGIASSYEWALVGRVMMGVGVAVVYIPIMKIQAQWFRHYEFATLTGILLTVGNIGALGAAGPLAQFVALTGWREAFYYLGAISIGLAALTFFLVRDKPEDMGYPTINEIDNIKVDITQTAKDDGIKLREAIKIAVTNRNFPWLAVYAFFVYGPMMGFQGLWAVPYMMDILGFSKQVASNVLSWWAVGMVVGCPLSGIISDRVMQSRKKVVIPGAIVYTLGWLYISLSPQGWSPVTMSIFCFIMGAFGGAYITNYAHLSERLPRKVVGTAIGVFNLFYFVGGAFFQQFMGTMLDGYGKVAGKFPVEAYTATFWLCFGGMVVGTAALFFTVETYIKIDKPVKPASQTIKA
ncbi:MFS transporter [Anaerosporomusa subterranea]|uniref:Lysosomal dipeptide transporter MFSD1 n=1 Tax=Anaerosporomusa subterranea TaxID=1794912 RepID=A0A154BS39_ANASB|nr:MFS transporter [Anaerosporomusa subterranea]KYZ76782.1 MFS transporter [Anaerosporomusa subterranea]